MLQQGEIKSPDDYARPVIIILRKPRKGEKMETGELAELSKGIGSVLLDIPPELLEIMKLMRR